MKTTATLLISATLLTAASAAEVTVSPKPFFISHTLSATALPSETTAIRLPAEVWSEFEILQIAPQGAKVAAGDVLVKFDTEDIDKKLTDARRAFAASEMNLAQAKLDLKTLQQSTPLKLDSARRAARNAKDELDYFTKTRRKALEESAAQTLKRAKESLESAKEELRQLEKMYQADDLTEETEEIILTRQKDAVARAEFGFRMEQLDYDRTLAVGLPRQLESLTTADKDAAIALAAAEEELPRRLKLAELSLTSATTSFDREKDNLAKLEADRKLFEIKAPAAGWFYYGAIEDGRWALGEMAKGLVVHGRAPVKRPFATFIPATAPLVMQAFADETAVRALTDGLAGTATVTGRSDTEIPAKLVSSSATPGTDGRYRATFSLDWPKGIAVTPGATADITVFTYQKDDALAVPAKALSLTPKGWSVEVKLADGKSEKRIVKRGLVSKEQVEILSGLEAGQVVIVP